MVLIFFDLFLFAGGYVASIYTWAWLKAKFTSVETTVTSEVSSLDAQLAALRNTPQAPAPAAPTTPAAPAA